MKKYLEIAKVVGVHGIRGSMKLQPWCDTADFLCGFKTLYSKDGSKSYNVVSAYKHKNVVIVSISGINTVEEAEKMRNRILYIDRDDVEMEDGVYFIQDLIGIDVIDIKTQKNYGKLTDVLETGANNVYQITSNNGKNYLIPAIKDVVIEIDIKNRKMLICPIKGIFEDED